MTVKTLPAVGWRVLNTLLTGDSVWLPELLHEQDATTNDVLSLERSGLLSGMLTGFRETLPIEEHLAAGGSAFAVELRLTAAGRRYVLTPANFVLARLCNQHQGRRALTLLTLERDCDATAELIRDMTAELLVTVTHTLTGAEPDPLTMMRLPARHLAVRITGKGRLRLPLF